MRDIARLHDAVTRASFWLAGIALILITGSYSFEVVSRYFFGAPTVWASPLVSYAMVFLIFLTFPEISRTTSHITVDFLANALTPERRKILERLCWFLAAAACLVAGWFTLRDTLNQFQRGIWTTPPLAVPKWIVAAVIPYGLISSGIHFMRHVCFGAPNEHLDMEGAT